MLVFIAYYLSVMCLIRRTVYNFTILTTLNEKVKQFVLMFYT
jgi:hypothetical protein